MITVLGKLEDTEAFVGVSGYNVLQANTSDWTLEFNADWLREAVHRKDSFLLVSTRATGQYANELRQLVNLLVVEG